MRFPILKIVFFLLLVTALMQCAKRSTPTGGPEDKTPPRITNARPDNYSTNFDEKTIRINFDEYIKLKDLQKQLIVSPPLRNQPEIFPQGSPSKYLEITLKDTLAENTTYVFNFGRSVVDNNEENPYPYFSYVFSTGPTIDSLSLSGVITDALQPKPDPFISVMLYRIDSTFTDSVIYKKPPTYITNTLDSSTSFTLTNLRAGRYLMVAMKDQASDYRFDPKNDQIGFVSEPVTVPSDSVYQLQMFREIPPFRAATPSLVAKNKIVFGYEGDPQGASITLLSQAPADFRSTIVPDPEKDSLVYYFTPFKTDSLLFAYGKQQEIDTFRVRIRDLYPDSLQINTWNKEPFSLVRPLALISNIPISQTNTERISVMRRDSVFMEVTARLDSTKTKLYLDWKSQPAQSYTVQLLPGAVTDFFGKENDSLSFNATTRDLSELGSIRVTLSNVDSYPVLVQITNEKGEPAYEKTAQSAASGPVEFQNIDPGMYRIRVIHDSNKNGKWDTGSYLEKRLPEKISYFPELIELRANWEIEQTFILNAD